MMKEYRVTKDMFLNEGPRIIAKKMKAAGFRFEREGGCPFVLSDHKAIETTDDAIIYRQWEN